MANIRGFLLLHFSKNYLLVFLPFFSILSVVYLVRISILSEKILLNATEILRLYAFFLPDILFYTLPLSFFIATATTLTKLSEENELLALFSFGMTPYGLLRAFFVPALLFTLLMLTLSLHSIPQNTLSYRLFVNQKSLEAKLSITPNQLGQRFGKYIVYLEGKEGDSYRHIVLFSTDNLKNRIIIMAENATIENNGSQFSLVLHQGTANTFTADSMKQIHYQKMQLFSYLQSNLDLQRLQRGWSQIRENRRDMAAFTYNLFLSLSPLLVLGIIAAFTIINPRSQRSVANITSFTITLLIYLGAAYLRREGTPLTLLLLSSSLLLASISLFKNRIGGKF